jgi:predicted nuclease of predicted toxin-antitoxin system
MGSATDEAIWQFAKDNGFTIVSKDSDFQERSVLRGSPPKIILLRVSNCPTTQIEQLLRSALPTVRRFIEQDHESCLILRPLSKSK